MLFVSSAKPFYASYFCLFRLPSGVYKIIPDISSSLTSGIFCIAVTYQQLTTCYM